jgi:hypothetical protein
VDALDGLTMVTVGHNLVTVDGNTVSDDEGDLTEVSEFKGVYGTPGGIRTPDPQVRSLMLYPAELPAHGSVVTEMRQIQRGVLRRSARFLSET